MRIHPDNWRLFRSVQSFEAPNTQMFVALHEGPKSVELRVQLRRAVLRGFHRLVVLKCEHRRKRGEESVEGGSSLDRSVADPGFRPRDLSDLLVLFLLNKGIGTLHCLIHSAQTMSRRVGAIFQRMRWECSRNLPEPGVKLTPC